MQLARELRQKVVVLTLFQFAFMLAISVMSQSLLSLSVAISLFSGAMIYWLPNGIFCLMVFMLAGARQQKRVVLSFYLGEVIKLALVSALFALAFLSNRFEALPLFVGFALCSLSQWSAPLFLASKKGSVNGC